jgi:hypothetical protein
MVGVQLELFDDIEVLNPGVEVAKRCGRSCIDDGPIRVFAREGFDGLHGLPACQHDKLDLIIDPTTAEVGAQETGTFAEFGHNHSVKMIGVGLCLFSARASAPLAYDHIACSPLKNRASIMARCGAIFENDWILDRIGVSLIGMAQSPPRTRMLIPPL